jgi:uncharacterized protein YfbU (UPF0304 family)
MATQAEKQHAQRYQELRDLVTREFGMKYHLSNRELATLLKEVLELLQEGDTE